MTRNLRLLRYALPQWRSLLALFLTTMLSVGISLARPWPLKLMVDNVLGGKPLSPPFQIIFFVMLPGPHDRQALLAWVCLSMVLVVLLGVAVNMGNAFATVLFGQRVTYSLAADLFGHLQRLSLLFHVRRPVGDTSARVATDSNCVQLLITGALLPLIQSLITIVATFVILWNLSPALTLVSLGALPLLFVATRIFAPPLKKRNRERRDVEGSVMSIIQETLTAIPVVQAFNREEREDARFRRYADKTVRAYVRTTTAELWFQLAVGLVLSVSTASLMYVGGWYAIAGKVTTGTIVLFLLYLLGFYMPLQSMSGTLSTVQLAAAEADRVVEILRVEPGVADSPGAMSMPLRGDIEYRHVQFGYLPDTAVLKDVSFDIAAGHVLAVVGPTGGGKSTLASLLIRLYDPWQGTIAIDGVDIRSITVRSLRRQVAIVLQEPFIFPISVAENISYGRREASFDEIVAAAKAANAHDFILALPDGYNTIIGERGATLSGGEKQRLSLARAFIMDAPILVLDEPTSAVDARTEGLLVAAIERLMKGRTTLVIAHRLSTIRNADKILVVDQGRIVEHGTHDQLLAQSGLYARMYRQQANLVQHEPAPLASVASNGASA